MYVLILIITLIFIFLFLFREPKFKTNTINNEIISPAYGKIYKITNCNNKLCISIILTLLDVHFQYVPCDGIVKNITYDNNGIFNIVSNGLYNKTKDNEKMIYSINTKHGNIIIYQIAGYYFSRIKSYIKEGDKVHKGNRLGLITFGSRVDICLPIKKNMSILQSEGSHITPEDILVIYN